MNFKAMREEIARIKSEKEALENNFDQWKRELARDNVRREPEAPRKRLVDELPNDDLITGAQFNATARTVKINSCYSPHFSKTAAGGAEPRGVGVLLRVDTTSGGGIFWRRIPR